MNEREYESVAQLRGCATAATVEDPTAFERANYMETLHSWAPSPRADLVAVAIVTPGRLTESGRGPMVGVRSQAPGSHSVSPKRAIGWNPTHGSHRVRPA